MHWMTMTFLVPCHALHAPQHAATSPFGPLNQRDDFFRPSHRSRLYIAGIFLRVTDTLVDTCQHEVNQFKALTNT